MEPLVDYCRRPTDVPRGRAKRALPLALGLATLAEAMFLRALYMRLERLHLLHR